MSNPSQQPPSLPTEQQNPNLYRAPEASPSTTAPAPVPLGENAGVRMLLPVGRSGWAIAAGYLGLFSMIILPAPIALIISIIAIWDIKKSKSRSKPKHGLGRAIFGLVMGLLGTALLAFFFIWRTVVDA